MIEILKYIAAHADRNGFYYDYGEGISVVINDFVLRFEFSDSDEDLDEMDSFSFIEDINTVASIFNKYPLSFFQLKFVEELGGRDGCIWEDEDDKKIYYDSLPTSVRTTILQIVRHLNEIPGLVENYLFDVYDPSDGYCDVDGNYAGYINLNPSQFNKQVIENLVECLKNFNPVEVPCNYCASFLRTEKFRNIFQPQFVNTNTKGRRLGYLKAFFRLINEKKKIPEQSLSKRFEEYALAYSEQIKGALNDKGLIISSDGKSAEPYVTLLKEFGLITAVNRAVSPTKWLRSFLVLQNQFPTDEKQIFLLNKLDKLFFLETLLRTDYLYFGLLLEMIYVSGKTSYQALNQVFQARLLDKLKTIESENIYGSQRSFDEIRSIIRRVSDWKNARVYLEHVLMPRLNWMLDLRLIEMDNLLIKLRPEGERLMTELNFWGDITCAEIANSSEYLDRYYPLIFLKTYQDEYGDHADRSIIINEVRSNIEASFELFKTLAPNRVTSSQAFTYSKYSLLLHNNRAISGKTHERILESELKDIFVYKYQPQYEDGYIQKIIK